MMRVVGVRDVSARFQCSNCVASADVEGHSFGELLLTNMSTINYRPPAIIAIENQIFPDLRNAFALVKRTQIVRWRVPKPRIILHAVQSRHRHPNCHRFEFLSQIISVELARRPPMHSRIESRIFHCLSHTIRMDTASKWKLSVQQTNGLECRWSVNPVSHIFATFYASRVYVVHASLTRFGRIWTVLLWQPHSSVYQTRNKLRKATKKVIKRQEW